MLKRVIFVLISVAFIWSCATDENRSTGPSDTSDPILTEPDVSKNVRLSFSNSTFRNSNSILSLADIPDEDIQRILVTVEASSDSIVFEKKSLDVYSMGQMYVSQPLSITKAGDYAITEFFVLNGEGDIIYASPLEDSKKAIYVHYPLPFEFSVANNADTTLPIEVTHVSPYDTPADFGYDGLGIAFVNVSLFEELTLEYLFNNNLNDTVGSNNGTSSTTPVFDTDRFGNEESVFLNASDKTAYIALDQEIDSSQVSISFWYNYGGSGGETSTLIGSNEWEYQHLIVHTNGALGFRNEAYNYFDTSLTQGEWCHIVYIKDGSRSRLYFNGQEVAREYANFDNALHPIQIIGNISTDTTKGALGSLDDFRIYTRVLSGIEVLALYDDQAPKVEITYPLENSVVSGTLMIEAVVEDDKDIPGVNFYVDDVLIGTDLSPPYSTSWDTSTGFNGSHSIRAKVFDSLKNMRNTVIDVSVNNAIHHDIAPISAGTYHSVAIRDNGVVYAWGYNVHGEVGDGTVTERQSPTMVKSLTNVVGVRSGTYHNIALRNDGTVWGWGYNASGELGDGSTITKITPTRVKNVSKIVSIATRHYHNLALQSDGTILSWGFNNYGQLGHHPGTNQLEADVVEGIDNVIAIATSIHTSYAVKTDGTVWVWGANNYGQAGQGTTTPDRYHSPVQVPGLEGVIAITAGRNSHVYALKEDGTVWAWGRGNNGSIGDSFNVNRYSPVKVNGLTNIRAIAAGDYHVLAIRSDGTVWSWGLNSTGQLGDGNTVIKYAPVKVKDLDNIVYIAAGDLHSMAVDKDGKIYTWGSTEYGQLGNGTSSGVYPVPIDVNWPLTALVPEGVSFDVYPGITNTINPRRVSAGHWFTNCIRDDASVWSWGHNANGELGIGNTTRQLSPLQTINISDMLSISAGGSHTLSIESNGTLWVWGYNAYGQLGRGDTVNSLIPINPANMSDVTDVTAGHSHSIIVKKDGSVWGWGMNSNGSVGDGSVTHRYTPQHVDELENIVKIASGSYHSIALKADGSIWSWGLNNHGQLGIGHTLNQTSPVKIETIENVIDIANGSNFSLALKTDGTVRSWGYNGNGELGDATTTSRWTPVEVNGLSNIVKLSASANNAFALDTDGNLWVWGYNGSGNLGDRTSITKYTPVRLDTITDVMDISGSMGYHHAIALKTDGTIWTWGRYDDGSTWLGALGSGLNENSNVPYNVLFP